MSDDVRFDKGRPRPNQTYNRKRERFILELYRGKPPQEAAEIAGYKPDHANSYRLANDPEVRARIAELYERERNFIQIEAMRARRERDIIAYSNIANYFEPVMDNDGKPTGRLRVKDFTSLPREVAAAIKSIKPTKLGWEITLHDKDAALRAIEKRVEPAIDQQPEQLEPMLGKKEQQILDAQNPEPTTSLGELMLQRQQGGARTH